MTNPATALYDLLESVTARNAYLPAAWEGVLGVGYNTVPFIRRYTEVLNLLSETARLLQTLPERTQKRHTPYASEWFQALLRTQTVWSQSSATDIISVGALHNLGALGDILHNNLKGTWIVPDDSKLDDLRDACERWRSSLDDFASLPDAVRRLIDSDLGHIIFLIGEVDKFGAARVAHEAQTLTGILAMAASQVADPTERGGFVARTKELVTKVAIFTTMVATPTAAALTSTALVLDKVNENVDQVADLLDGPEKPGDLSPPAGPAADPAPPTLDSSGS